MTQRNLNPNSPFFHEERYASLAPFVDKLITICGAGTLGGNLAETLARMGFAHLKLIDKDGVETRNLSTQPYSRAEVGAPKARILANMLYRAVQAKIEPAVTELTPANSEDLLRGSVLVVDAFDDWAARSAVSETARALQLPCLHIGFSPDGLYGSGLWEPHYKVPHDTSGDPCDYPLTRPLALVLTALAARSICDHFSKGQSNNFELTWNDLKIEYAS
jgi:molybdopterin-synthase adenylyltransferase